jgi:hypothetical protein
VLNVDFKGLVTAPGLLMRTPASCTVAQNALFDAPGLVRKRPGFQRGTFAVGAGVHSLFSSPLLGDSFLVHEGAGTTGTGMRIATGFAGSSGVPAVDSSAVSRSVVGVKQQMALSGRSHYLTSDEGLRRIELTASPVRFAGMPRGLSPSQESGLYNVLVATAPTWLTSGHAAAYRATWHRVDVSGIELGGAPTGRAIVRNIAGTTGHTGGARSVSIRVPVPREFGTLSTPLTTSYFFRLWRSRQSVTEPDDEMYLVAEAFLTATDITNGFAVVNDLTPDAILIGNARLHTNPVNLPDGEPNALKTGQFNADDPPPSANDVATWRDCLWVGDIITRPAYTAQLLSVGGSGLVAGDTVTLDGINTMTASGGAPGANQFQVVTTLPTLALNIEATMRNIVDRHNSLYACLGTSPVFAYYISQSSQAPGQIFVEAKQQGGGANPATSKPSAFRLPSSASVLTATNRLRYSKPGRADAMPVINELDVGPRSSTVLRIVPYRDRLLVFTDLGIYQVTGSSYLDFEVSPFDLTYRLLGRNLVAVCDDRVYAWCAEGIIEIDEGGVRVISMPIEPTVTQIVARANVTLPLYGFAVGYRLQHRVVFMHPFDNVDGALGCILGFVWDTRTRAWSSLSFTDADVAQNGFKSAGVVRFSDDRLVLGWWNPGGGDGQVFVERRALDSTDYTDDDAAGNVVTFGMALTWQFQVPDAEGATHWQQTMLHFDGGEFAWRANPTAAFLTYETEWAASVIAGGAVVATPPLGVSAVVRVEVPRTTRRGQRLRLTVVAPGGAFGLVGVSQSFRPGARFARRD